MRFLLVQSAPHVPALGGANKHNRALLEDLAARGHDCAVVALGSPEVLARVPGGAPAPVVSFRLAGVSVDAVIDGSRLREHVVRRIHDFAPDRVLVSSEDPAQALLEAALEASPGRVVYLAHTTLGLPCGPQAFVPSEKRTALLRRTTAILAASRYVADYLSRWAGIEAAVLPIHFYPASSPALGRFEAGAVTLINPCAVKGISIFLELARRLPETPFAAVPTWGTTAADRAALAALPNVTLLPPSEEIHEILAQTRILLVPSLWAEAFGGICVEAMLCGIPVLASAVGGLPEAMLGLPDLLPVRPIERYLERLDDRGIPVPEIPPQDAAPWLDALRRLLADRALYERRSRQARAAAGAYVAAIDRRQTEAFLRDRADRAPVRQAGAEPSRRSPAVPAAAAGAAGGTDDELRRRLDRISPGKLELLKLRLKKSAGAPAAAAVPASIPRQPRRARQGAGEVFPLSFAQQRLWLLHRIDPESAAYNEFLFARLTGALEPAALAAALDGLAERHELLRTRYVETEGEPRQVVDPPRRRPLPAVCLRALPDAVRGAEMERVARQAARRPFDLERGPVLNALLLRLGEDEHLLVVVVHHIAADHWAITIALSELSVLYAAAAGRAVRPVDLPPLPIQYADFAVHERQWLSGPVLESFLDAWRRQLAGAPPVLDLPSDRPRPAHQTFRGARARLVLTPSQTAALKERARQEGATLYMLLLAGLQALLHRLTGREDFVLGTPVAGRNRVETERLIGYFLNVLPLRGRPRGDLPFHDLLAQARQATLDAFARQELPFEKLVEDLAPERSLSFSPLFQTLLNLQNVPVHTRKLADLDLEPLPIEIGIAKFDLDLYLEELDQALIGSAFYSTDLFDAPTVERMMQYLVGVLAHAAARPEDPLAAFPLLAAAQVQQVLVEWNDSGEETGAADLPALVAAQAARTPKAVAVVGAAGKAGDTGELTYRELVARAGRLARHLRRLGVGPEVLVGLAVERSPDLVVALLGILAAGGAYLPLDDSYPRERLSHMLADSRPEVLLATDSRTADRFADLPGRSEHAPRVLRLDREWEAIDREPGTDLPDGGASPDNLAYVLFTSGSTGRPKGVQIPRRALVNFLLSMRRAPGCAAGERLLAVTSLAFDIAALEIFLPLLSGGAVELASREEAADPQALAARMARAAAASTAIWSMQSTPATWRMLLAAGWAGDRRLRALCGGEALPPDLAAALAARVGELWNLYGPTETTVWSSRRRLRAGERVTIGRPIAATSLYVLDAAGAPAPPGVPGELLIGGLGLARGYLGRPDLTAASFVPDPFVPGSFAAPAGRRLYRTGDLARTLPDGQIEHLGRRDHQVKVRGFRIETAEVELALALHPGVAQAVVAARHDPAGTAYLAAWLVPESAVAPTARELHAFLAETLPEFMIPSVFVPLAELPLTANRKLDRQALPELPQAADTVVFTPPASALEEAIAALWEEVLGAPRVGRHDNFFELGGHSLLAAQLVSRLWSCFAVELPVRRVFEAPTLAELAAQVESLRAPLHGGRWALPPLERLPRPLPADSADLPLSFAQQRLWFLDRLEPGSAAYNMPAALRLRGALDPAALEASFAEVVRRHEVLRTRLPATPEGVPMQVIEPLGSWRLSVSDLTGLGEPQGSRERERLARAEARRPFDLARGPLWRASLLGLGPEEHLLLFTLHHAAGDGWSLGILVREVAAFYEAFAEGRPSPLPELPIQYADFAVWQRDGLRGEALAALLGYWRERLDGLAPLELPTDRPRPATQTFRGTTRMRILPAHLHEALAAYARSQGATLYMALLAAWATLLGRSAGQDDVAVGSPIANRTRAELEELIGCFTNTLVLRVGLDGNPSFETLLGRARELALAAYAHEDLPFEKIVAELVPERDLSRSPLFQVVLELLNAPMGEIKLGTLSITRVAAVVATAKFDLTLALQETGEGLKATAEYNVDLFDGTRIERLLRQFERLLEGAVAEPGCRLADLPLVGDAERHQLLVEWSDTATAAPVSEPFDVLFRHQVERSPEAVAAVCEEWWISYGELDRRTDAAARRLAGLDVRPGVVVALLADRGLDFLGALLAVLRAGGAHLPLDPGQPAQRLATVLTGSGAALVVTSGELRPVLDGVLAAIPQAARPLVVLLEELLAPGAPGGVRPVGATPGDLAYVLYTSGSTGVPKGAMIEQRGMVNHLSAKVLELGLTAEDHLAQNASQTFDISIWQFLSVLLVGGSVHVYRDVVAHDPVLLLERTASDAVTVLQVVPSLLRVLVEEAEQLGASRPDLSALRWIIPNGEALAPELCHRWLAVYPAVPLINAYGPTECSDDVSQQVVAAPVRQPRTPIGRPLANLRLRLLDREMRPVPIGAAGELCVAGIGVGRGYLCDPGRTAEVYVPDPFAAAPGGARQYRTGDLVRFLADGSLDFLQRIDHQVKVRGFRIELGEIEATLAAHPGVREAVALVRQHRGEAARLVAWFVPRAAEVPSVEELRVFLGDRLPEYMVPAAFAALARLPLTPNGKLDLHALPEPTAERPQLGHTTTAPRTPLEALLLGIWKVVLGLDEVGVHDNFFSLGGDSILSIQVAARAGRAGYRITPVQIFERQTIAGLAAVAERKEGGLEAAGGEAEHGPLTGPVPLTPIQRWFFAQDLPSPEHHNQALLLEAGGLDGGRLASAVGRLLAHHDALRLRFVRTPSGWQQAYAAPEGPAPASEVDLMALPAKARGTALEAAAARLQASLSLGAGPVFRAARFLLEGETPGAADRLLLVAHHLVVDGVSWRILLEDLWTAHQRGELPPRSASFRRWAEQLAAQARTAAVVAQAAWWLAFEPPPALPVDLAAGANGQAAVRSVEVALSPEETSALLREVPRAYRSQINDALLSALAEAFAAWTGERRLWLGIEGHGREEIFPGLDLSRTVGWFTSLFPVLLDLDAADAAGAAAGPGEALKTVKERLRAVPGRGLPFGLLAYGGDGEVAEWLRALPRPGVVFNYLGQLDSAVAEGPFRPARESAGPASAPGQPRPQLLEIVASVQGGRLRLRWEYSANRHRRATVESLAAAHRSALRRLIEHCREAPAGGATPSDFPLAHLAPAALDRLVAATGGWIEDLYPISPMQLGMLLHSLAAPGSGVYILQLKLALGADLDAAAFARAGQRLVDRHPPLRAAFWPDLEQPLQAVLREVRLPWERLDWRDRPTVRQRSDFAAWLERDRGQDFELSRAPLLRAALIDLGAAGYRFVLSHHQSLFDGWSLPILVRDLFALYRQEVSGRPAELAPARPYRDFVAWREEQDTAASEAFWRQTLEGFAAPTPLGIDRPERPAEPRAEEPAAASTRWVVLSAAATDALRLFTRGLGVTLNTAVQGAWALLLHRYSGEDDVLFGAVSAGRSAPLPGIESSVGQFVNTLPVRVRMPRRARLGSWLREIQERQVEARQHEHSSLAEIQRWSAVPAGRPLFESLLAFENFPLDEAVEEVTRQRLDLTEVEVIEQPHYPLNLLVSPGARLRLQLLYDPRRIAPPVERLLHHLESLLGAFAPHADRSLADLPLLTGAERHQLIHEWNDTGVELAPPLLLHRLFTAQAMRSPDVEAVVLADEPTAGLARLTYRELDRRSNQLARHLVRLGVGPDVPVAIAAERSLEMVWGLLGILKAGSAYVPLDPTYPQERLRFMLADAFAGLPAPVLLCQEHLAERLPVPAPGSSHGPVTIVRIDADWPRIAKESGDLLGGVQDPDHLAYVIYTSGSTGRPKGAMNTHRAICNRLLWMQDAYHLTPEDRVLQKTPFSFDVSVWEIFLPLLTGARLVMARPEGHRDSAYLARVVAAREISCLHFVPSLLGAFLAEPEVSRCGSLRKVMASGEALSLPLCQRFFATLDAELHNLYGPTEAAVDVTFHACRRGAARGVPIGRPISNLSIHLLDAELRPVPAGVPGELSIGGVGLARGYHGRPDLTAERFVPDPFGLPATRLYRSGDLARRRPDGEVEFLGRLDHQVKVRGNRIELGEIEAVLTAHPAVREAVVVARTEPSGTVRLVAYLTAQPEGEAALAAGAAGELRGVLGRTLPEFMVPAAFMVLPSLPLTPSGKVDRRALPAPDPGSPGRPQPAAPRTAMEELLVGIWRDVLRLDSIGVSDHFFALGGDSILGLQVISRLAQAGYRVSPRQLFDHPTVAALAEVVEQAPRAKAEAGRVTGAVPLTPVQHWFFDQQLPRPEHFNQAVLLKAEPWLTGPLLRQAVGHLLAHHDALRLRFTPGPQGWRQVHGGAEPAVLQLDLAALGTERQAAALEEAAKHLQASFDLTRGPLLRAALFTLGAGQAAWLLLVAQHLVVDGVSWRFLLEDLVTASRQLARGERVALPPKTSSFKSWAERLVEYARSPALRREAVFWRDRLGRPVAALPLDHSALGNDVGSSRTVVRSLDTDETRALLRELPEVYRTQVDEALLTALAAAFAAWTGQRRVLLDVENHGREEIFDDLSLARTVGWFTAIFPLLLELGEEAGSPGEILKTVKEQVRAVPVHGLGYGVVRYLGLPEDTLTLKALPRAEVLFNYLGQLDQALPQGGSLHRAAESAGAARAAAQPRAHLLEVEASIGGGKLRVVFRYSAHRHRLSTIEELADRCLAALTELIVHGRSLHSLGARVFTPADFPLAGLDATSLDRLLRRSGAVIEDVYPLSPLQQGLLFDSLLRPGGGLYVQQLGCELHGELDVPVLLGAWDQVVARHTALRTAFFWEDLEKPLQVVSQRLALPWTCCDLRRLSAETGEAEGLAYLAADRRRGFDVSRPPLLRLALFRLADDRYRLVWSYHHLLLDGWSLPLLLREVFALYAAACRGRRAPLPRPRPYRDYVSWLVRQDMSRAEDFWRRRLAGFRSPTPLPAPRRARAAGRGEAVAFDRVESWMEGAATVLVERARALRLTLSTLLQGAWAVLLSRYSGEPEVAFGAVTSGRAAPVPELATMIGLFINTLPVRVEVPDAALPSAWLAGLQAEQVQAREHEHAPLVVIQGWSEVERGRPLFESLVVFENFPAGAALEGEEEPGIVVAGVEAIERTGYPLTLVAEPGDRLHLKLMYDGGRFDAPTARRLLRHLENVLQALVDPAERPLADLPLLALAERHQMLHEWNDTRGDLASTLLLHRLFEVQAERAPDAEAIVLAEEPSESPGRLTYRELDFRSNQLARYLTRLGVEPDVPVAVVMERSLEMMVGLLGILKAGGAYVPLDPTYPRERLTFMLADALARVPSPVLLTQEGIAERLALAEWNVLPAPPAIVQVDAGWSRIATESGGRLEPRQSPDHLAYVIYTSGSTGKPKGAMNSHRAICNRLLWMQDAYGLTAEDRVLQKTPFSFDVSVWELFWPLVTGARLVMARPEGHKDSAYLARVIAARGISHLHFVPSMLQAFLDEPDLTTCRSLRRVMASGEALPPELAQRFVERLEAELHNLYGPTEAAVDVTFHACRPNGAMDTVPIGRPIANLATFLLDAGLRPVPIGVPGELYLGGVGLARGYFGRPDLTAERFLPHFAGRAGERLYRTGDLARVRGDGEIEFLGRIDHQVKLRGFRIELGEIEAALGRHPEVRAAAVSFSGSGSGERSLVAYVVAREPLHGLAAPELRRFLAESLPEFMVPSFFVILPRLPLTASGKLDRRALPAPGKPQRDATLAYVAPRSQIERTLGDLWQEVLQVDRVGVHDNFFDLGGHSLLVLRLHGRLRGRLGREVALMDLFQYPTIASLAARLGGGRAEPALPEEREGEHLQRLREGRGRLRRRSEKRRGG